ncbi:MAG: sigma-70 family RNA polymerase sigma factor [Actinomycetota bacterium]
MAETDVELLGRVAERDANAFETIYRRYGPSAYGVAVRVLRQPALAEEVVADAFLAVWTAPHAYDSTRGTFRMFLLSLVHHRAVDAVRREERLRAREQRANPPPVPDEDVMETVVEEADLADRRRRVRHALAELPADQRKLLEMMYFQGKTQSKIAEEERIPLGTVKSRVFTAMRKLREMLT